MKGYTNTGESPIHVQSINRVVLWRIIFQNLLYFTDIKWSWQLTGEKKFWPRLWPVANVSAAPKVVFSSLILYPYYNITVYYCKSL